MGLVPDEQGLLCLSARDVETSLARTNLNQSCTLKMMSRCSRRQRAARRAARIVMILASLLESPVIGLKYLVIVKRDTILGVVAIHYHAIFSARLRPIRTCPPSPVCPSPPTLIHIHTYRTGVVHIPIPRPGARCPGMETAWCMLHVTQFNQMLRPASHQQ